MIDYVNYIEIYKRDLDSIDKQIGNFIYCTDTEETFLDAYYNVRLKLKNVVYVFSELDRENIERPMLNTMYAVRATKSIYKYEKKWFTVLETTNLLSLVYLDEIFIETTLKDKKGNTIVPITVDTAVRMDNTGIYLKEELDSIVYTTENVTKIVYGESTEANRSVFRIPFPIDNYDFKKNLFEVMVNDLYVEPSNYTISNKKYITFNKPLEVGSLIKYIFKYNLYVSE